MPSCLPRPACASSRSGAAKEWLIDPDDDEMLRPGDVLIVRGAAEGIPELRVLAGAPEWRVATLSEDPALSDLDRAVDVLVEMKDVSEAAVGLAYSALLFNDQGLAAEVSSLENRLDEMRERLELWVLRGAAETVDPSALRGLLHLGGAAEEIGDAAQQMVWLVEEGEELHPVLNAALGDTDDVIMRVPVAAGSELDGRGPHLRRHRRRHRFPSPRVAPQRPLLLPAAARHEDRGRRRVGGVGTVGRSRRPGERRPASG